MKDSLVPIERIESKIFLMRGKKIMLDKDLAELYGVKPIALRQQVKRNIDRFPEDFMFQLTKEEVDILVSHFVIPSKKHLGGYLPYAFTEQGVAMLSSVLNSKTAILVNIQIIRVFTRLQEMVLSNEALKRKIEAMEKKYDHQFKVVFDALKSLLSSPAKKIKRIGFRNEENHK